MCVLTNRVVLFTFSLQSLRRLQSQRNLSMAPHHDLSDSDNGQTFTIVRHVIPTTDLSLFLVVLNNITLNHHEPHCKSPKSIYFMNQQYKWNMLYPISQTIPPFTVKLVFDATRVSRPGVIDADTTQGEPPVCVLIG